MLLHIALPGSGTSAFDFWANDILPAHCLCGASITQFVLSAECLVLCRPRPRLSRRLSSGLRKRTRQDWLIRGHIMFKAGDPRVAVMPEAFAIPRLAGELVPALLRKDQLDQRLQLLPGISRH